MVSEPTPAMATDGMEGSNTWFGDMDFLGSVLDGRAEDSAVFLQDRASGWASGRASAKAGICSRYELMAVSLG